VLVGNSRSRTVDFVNSGGHGRFLLLPAHEWASLQAAEHQQQQQQQVATFTSTSGSSPNKAAAVAAAAAAEPATAYSAAAAAVCGPFAVTPMYLELPSGSSGRLTVNFSPEVPGQHAGDFVLICDNCTVWQLRLVGCGSEVDVQLVEIDGRQLQQEDAQAPVWFGQVSMADVGRRRNSVCNAKGNILLHLKRNVLNNSAAAAAFS
jgi:hypothetical protein